MGLMPPHPWGYLAPPPQLQPYPGGGLPPYGPPSPGAAFDARRPLRSGGPPSPGQPPGRRYGGYF